MLHMKSLLNVRRPRKIQKVLYPLPSKMVHNYPVRDLAAVLF